MSSGGALAGATDRIWLDCVAAGQRVLFYRGGLVQIACRAAHVRPLAVLH